MPWTITVFPVKPPSVKRSPVRTSVSEMRRTGDVVAVDVAALVGVAEAMTDAAAAAVGEGVTPVAAGAAGPAQPTLSARARPRAIPHLVRIWQQYVGAAREVLSLGRDLTLPVASGHR